MFKSNKKSTLENKRCGNLRNRAANFAASEKGTMTILTMSLMAIVFLVTGWGVDMMRFDRERSRLQSALDRAVLAAADLDQDLCPKDVVRDYLSKEGLDQYLVGEIKVTPQECGSEAVTLRGYRRVEASAEMNVEMHFDFLFDYRKDNPDRTLQANATSVAEEAIDDVEISMVLDVSGSMNSNNRLVNLKKAATNFVQEMVDKTEDGKLSISVVPYATQVSVPDALMNELNTRFENVETLRGENRRANCINFTPEDLSTSTYRFVNEANLPIIRDRTLHFTPWSTYDRRAQNSFVSNEVCDDQANREVLVLEKDAEVLKNRINSFTAGGNTSIDLGLKWGITLLDPSFRPVISDLAQADEIPSEFTTRPHNYNSGQSMKVIILMTDGANTTQYQVRDPYREGDSMLFWNTDFTAYSIYDEDNDRYFWRGIDRLERDNFGRYWIRDTWQNKPYGGERRERPDGSYEIISDGTYTVTRCYNWDTYYDECYYRDPGQTQTRTVLNSSGQPAFSEVLEWPEVWERTTRRQTYNILRDSLGNTFASNWYNNTLDFIGQSKKDPSVRALCDIAKANDIVIFSIAFEAPDAGKSLLNYCKTDENSYYEASGENIVSVFASIGSTIRNLRLTQ